MDINIPVVEAAVTGSASVATEVKPTTIVAGKKAVKTGDLIQHVAGEIESLTKIKAINEAEKLADTIETSYFRLGGVLNLIKTNSWFEGYPDFDTFVFEKFGFQSRKASYLIQIYVNLVTKQIQYESVQHLGWTKLKDLAPVLTLDNLAEWVAKATPCTVLELQAMLKAVPNSGEATESKTKDDIVKMTFKLKADQNTLVTSALQKAKGELSTEFDTVALEGICSGYLGGNSAVSKGYDLDTVIKDTGIEVMLTRISELFPEFDINVEPAGSGEAVNEQEQATEIAVAAE